MRAAPQRDPVFRDLLVVEAGGRIAAGVAGSALAQLGATVIVLESTTPDARPHLKWSCRAQFLAGKHSVVIDPERDRVLLADLLGAADLLLCSSDTDSTRYEARAGAATVVCDITAFGGSGPLADARSGDCSDMAIQALTGMLDSTGLAGHAPTPIALPLVEQLAGMYAAGGAVCALRQRAAGGVTQNLDIALYDIAFSAMNSFLAPVLASGGTKGVSRVGNRHNMAAPWNVYRAADEWLLLCSGSDEQWQRLCRLIGRADLGTDPRCAKNADRVAHVELVDAAVQDWIGQRPVAECVQAILALGLPCGAVAPIDDMPREANLAHRGMVRQARDPVSDRDLYLPGSPWRMSATPGAARLRIPLPDEDRALAEMMARRGAPECNPQAAARPALAGLRVIEIGHYTTVPVAARVLGGLGAEVIKVEPPGGEAVRNWPPHQHGRSVFFVIQNTDKKSVVIDMDSAADRAALHALIAGADVLIENLRPGALTRKGFGPADLLRRNPRLIYCSVAGFGADSLYPGRAAFDTVIQAMSGLMDATRAAGQPMKTGPSLADMLGAGAAFFAIVAALAERDRSGQGQFIDLSMQDIAAWSTQMAWNGQPVQSRRARLLAARDGYVLAESATDAVLQAALHGIDTATLTRHALTKALTRAHLPAWPVHDVREAVAAPQTHARRLWFRSDGTPDGYPLLAIPVGLRRTPPVVSAIASDLGADNALAGK